MKLPNIRRAAAGALCSALLFAGAPAARADEIPGVAEITKAILDDVLKILGISLEEAQDQAVIIPVLVYNLTDETQYWSATVGGSASYEHVSIRDYDPGTPGKAVREIGGPWGLWSDQNPVKPGEVQQVNFHFNPGQKNMMAPDDKVSFGGRKNGAKGAGWYNIKISNQQWKWCGAEITEAMSCAANVNKVGMFYQGTGGIKGPDKDNQNNFVMVHSYLTKPDAEGKQKVCLYPSLVTPYSSNLHEFTLTKSIWKMARDNKVAGMEPVVFAWIPTDRALDWESGCMDPAEQPEQPEATGGEE